MFLREIYPTLNQNLLRKLKNLDYYNFSHYIELLHKQLRVGGELVQ